MFECIKTTEIDGSTIYKGAIYDIIPYDDDTTGYVINDFIHHLNLIATIKEFNEYFVRITTKEGIMNSSPHFKSEK